MKKISLILCMAILVVLTGCSKAQTITCERDTGERLEDKIKCEFKNGKVDKCSITFTKEYDSLEEAQSLYEYVKKMDNADAKIDGKTVTITQYKLEETENKTYDEARTIFKNAGYNCK